MDEIPPLVAALQATREYQLIGQPVVVSWTGADGGTKTASGIMGRAVSGSFGSFVEFTDGRQFDMAAAGFNLTADTGST